MSPPKHSFRAESFWGGDLVEDHDVGGMIPDLVQTLVITLVTFAILELQPWFKKPNGPNR